MFCISYIQREHLSWGKAPLLRASLPATPSTPPTKNAPEIISNLLCTNEQNYVQLFTEPFNFSKRSTFRFESVCRMLQTHRIHPIDYRPALQGPPALLSISSPVMSVIRPLSPWSRRWIARASCSASNRARSASTSSRRHRIYIDSLSLSN